MLILKLLYDDDDDDEIHESVTVTNRYFRDYTVSYCTILVD